MQIILQSAKRTIDRVLEAGTILSAIGIILAVSIQVTARLLLPIAPAWTEEAARMSFLFLVAFAAALAVRDGAFVSIDTLLRSLPARIATAMQCVIHLTITGFMILVAWYSVPFVQLGMDQKSPCLQIPMAYVHSSVLLLASTVALYSALEAVNHLGKLTQAAPTYRTGGPGDAAQDPAGQPEPETRAVDLRTDEAEETPE